MSTTARSCPPCGRPLADAAIRTGKLVQVVGVAVALVAFVLATAWGIVDLWEPYLRTGNVALLTEMDRRGAATAQTVALAGALVFGAGWFVAWWHRR